MDVNISFDKDRALDGALFNEVPWSPANSKTQHPWLKYHQTLRRHMALLSIDQPFTLHQHFCSILQDW